GDLVRVFANENRKITCDPEMQNHIEKTLYSGHASFKVSLSVTIPYGNPTEFFIIGSNGSEHLLRADGSTTDVSWLVKGGKEGRRVYSFTSDAGILLVNVCQL
ncbi:hypothetical protein CUMW_247720, partial [Citrus unshiu]